MSRSARPRGRVARRRVAALALAHRLSFTTGAVVLAAGLSTASAAFGTSVASAAGSQSAAVRTAPPTALPRVTAREETPIGAPAQDGVSVSLVRLRAPLPANAAAHPEACDWIQYERFRSSDGPADAGAADSVAVLMPGNLEGAGAFDPLARNAVRAAARRGEHIEVWATDRRANCLEDLTGLNAFERSGDPADYTGYYYRGREIDGHRFAGWQQDPRVLADLGVAQTVVDYHALLSHELPDQAWREQHVICGGHSLAGALVELYASWDFDGDPATTADAGYRQCAGFMGFETLLDIGLTSGEPANPRSLQPIVPGIRFAFGDPARRALRAGTLKRHEELLGIGPETMALMEATSILATRTPDAEATDWLRSIPTDTALRLYYRLAGSPTFLDYVSGRTRLTDLRFTYAALLGQMFDDNGSALSVIRASFGYPTGARLIRNRLPEQLQIPGIDWLFRPGPVMIARRTTPQPLEGWANYDQLGGTAGGGVSQSTGGSSGAAQQLGGGPSVQQLGVGVTSPQSEVTDAREFARILHDGPSNLTESWFPTRIVTDIGAVGAGDRGGGMAGAIHPHPTRNKPRFVVLGSMGVVLRSNMRPLDPHVVLPGYEHLDVLTAAEHQNSGAPEGSSTALVDFIDRATR